MNRGESMKKVLILLLVGVLILGTCSSYGEVCEETHEYTDFPGEYTHSWHNPSPEGEGHGGGGGGAPG